MTITGDILLYALLFATLVLAGVVIYLWRRVDRLLRGKDAATLEDTMRQLLSETDELNKSREEIEAYLKQVESRLRKSVSGIATVRFNPFKGSSGSNQSFATALLSEEGNGVILSTLYSRDRVSIFAKPVLRGSSQYELTDEEKEAIAKTRGGR